MQTDSTRESEAVNLCADRAHLQSNGHADPDLAEGINGPEDPTTADAGHPAATAEVLAFPPYEHNRDSFGECLVKPLTQTGTRTFELQGFGPRKTPDSESKVPEVFEEQSACGVWHTGTA